MALPLLAQLLRCLRHVRCLQLYCCSCCSHCRSCRSRCCSCRRCCRWRWGLLPQAPGVAAPPAAHAAEAGTAGTAGAAAGHLRLLGYPLPSICKTPGRVRLPAGLCTCSMPNQRQLSSGGRLKQKAKAYACLLRSGSSDLDCLLLIASHSLTQPHRSLLHPSSGCTEQSAHNSTHSQHLQPSSVQCPNPGFASNTCCSAPTHLGSSCSPSKVTCAQAPSCHSAGSSGSAATLAGGGEGAS